MRNVGWAIGVIGLAVLAVLGVAVYDVTQRRHAILRSYPVIGHFRHALESFGPELRQYILTSNDEEKPFSRDQRRWIYTSAYRRDNTFGFGTDNHLDTTPDYLIVVRAAFPELPNPAEPAGPEWSFPVPCAKVVGGVRRAGAFRPSSLVNISGMSLGRSPALRSSRSTGPLRSSTATRTPARAGSRCTTATAAISWCRWAPGTSVAGRPTGRSRCPGSSTRSPVHPCGPSR